MLPAVHVLLRILPRFVPVLFNPLPVRTCWQQQIHGETSILLIAATHGLMLHRIAMTFVFLFGVILMIPISVFIGLFSGVAAGAGAWSDPAEIFHGFVAS